MPLYLPIAELSMNIFLVIGMGAVVGFLSGMFGVGGGFLMTPLLIFSGVPPAVAVATESNEITAASVSGALAHWRRQGVDVKMGAVLIVGGAIGSFFGAQVFTYLKSLGQVDLMIALAYVVFLGSVGGLMFWESMRAIYRQYTGYVPPKLSREDRHKAWIHALPFKMRFRKSRLYISAILPLAIGMLVGVLAAIMGVGGGFIMVPAMIYILGMPTNVVVGTSLFQIIFVTALTTIFHSVNTQTVDIFLAVLLLFGAVIGAQVGARVGLKMKGEQLRALLAVMVLGVCIKMGFGLVIEPEELYSVAEAAEQGGH
ncbi:MULTISPECIES: sulfite exporter TauE/SafE family protein [Kordiimonas]|uniref:sulfite exporter TauE/SafE family protein n=1 Tax=Kordiimonas TaxID=288021 RepID=UPI001FF39B6F|nr:MULTISPECIES: sulfite exporter TauE/SafE family protein [Kordiimonas]MCK0069220.1 sulfite exporter TauE/SafE family protein [Kordiimonas laminariae]UTW58554.1 sulfite exporter TauE/SafE family protein [Kordiimonas sp. SCSIO 12603]